MIRTPDLKTRKKTKTLLTRVPTPPRGKKIDKTWDESYDFVNPGIPNTSLTGTIRSGEPRYSFRKCPPGVR